MSDLQATMGTAMRTAARLLLGGLLAGVLATACSESVGQAHDDEDGHEEVGGHSSEAGEHGHAGEHGAETTDPHHAALHVGECEDDVTLTAEAVAVSGIRVAPARSATLAGVVHAPARVSLRADAVARLGSPLRGRVVELPAKLGDRVEQGQCVLVAESPEFGEAQADFLQKSAQARALAPAVEIARSTFERARGLLESIQGVTLTEVQKRESEYRAAERDLAFARAAATAAANRLVILGYDDEALAALDREGRVDPRFQVCAPFAGQVIERAVTLGELVGPEKDALLVLADTTRLWIMAHVPESRLGEVVPGTEARIAVAALGISDLLGTVAAIAPTLDAETRNAEVRIEVDNSDGRLLPGMFAQATIRGTTHGTGPVLAVPDGAVQTVEGEPSVFVAVDDQGLAFCRHGVVVDEPVQGSIPVLGGLQEGELLAVSGTFVLKAELGRAAAAHAHDH